MTEIDTKKIFQLKQEIAALLRERPELIPLQNKIDELMAGAGNQHNRCVLISELMKDKFGELTVALKDLQDVLIQRATEMIEDQKQALVASETEEKEKPK